MPRDIPREPTLPVEPATPVEIAPGHFRPVERTDFILVCKIPGNGGNVYWMKDGKQISMNLVDIDGNLPFSSIQLPDSGLYTCISGDRRRSYNAAVDVVPDNINGKFVLEFLWIRIGKKCYLFTCILGFGQSGCHMHFEL